MKTIRQYLKSRTINFSLLLGVAGAVQANFEQIHALIPAKYYGLALMVIGVVVAALRVVTTTAVKDK